MAKPVEREPRQPEFDYRRIEELLTEMINLRNKEPVCECECPNGGAGAKSKG
jgi:hypothetical protein